MTPSFATAIFIVVAAYVAGAESASCLENTATFSKLAEVQAECLTTLNLTASEIPSGKDLKEKHFDDQCMSSCILESANFYKNGTILKETILETLKKEVTSEVYQKLEKTVEKCVEKAKLFKKQKDDKDKKNGYTSTPRSKGMKMSPDHELGKNVTCSCRRAAKFVYCMLKDREEC